MSKETLNTISAAVIIGIGVTFVVAVAMQEIRARNFDRNLLGATRDIAASVVVIPDDASEI